MDQATQRLMMGAAGAGEKTLYVDDVFSIDSWVGNGGSSQTKTNGIDLAGEGGLVWSKRVVGSHEHGLYDTERGVNKRLSTDSQSLQDSISNGVTSFNSNGFTHSSADDIGGNGDTYAGYTFRKCPKFFTVVKYTGNGTAGRTVDHDLEVTPGSIIVKGYDNASGNRKWGWYHRGAASREPNSAWEYTKEFGSGFHAYVNAHYAWDDTAPTSTNFTLGAGQAYNQNGVDYVAYLFAHNCGGFGGEDVDASIITCGRTLGRGTAPSTSNPYKVNLGWQPQFLIYCNAEESSDIFMLDSLRACSRWGGYKYTYIDSNQGSQTSARLELMSDGFQIVSNNVEVHEYNRDLLWIAIRAPDGEVGKGKEGSDFFSVDTGNNSSTYSVPALDSTHLVDGVIAKQSSDNSNWYMGQRTLNKKLTTIGTSNSDHPNQGNEDWCDYFSAKGWGQSRNSNWYAWMWKRGKTYDQGTFIGNGSSQQVYHKLGSVPGLIICRNYGSSDAWRVYHSHLNLGTNPQNYYLQLNSTNNPNGRVDDAGAWNDTAPTNQHFTVGSSNNVNQNGDPSYWHAWAADVTGLCKTGLYTGNNSASAFTIDLGFQPRFFMTVPTYENNGSTLTGGDWAIYDYHRGLGGSTNARARLNNKGDVDGNMGAVFTVSSTGITFNSGFGEWVDNRSGYKYIYFAHA